MDHSREEGQGLWFTLRRLVDTVLAAAEKRFELFTLELQEEKVRVCDLVWRVAAIIVLGFLTLIAATALVVVWLWDTSPVAVLGVVTLAYGLTAAGLAGGVKRRLQRGARPFAGTLAELKKDRECLRKHD